MILTRNITQLNETIRSKFFSIFARNIDTMCVSKSFNYHKDIESEINEQINREQLAGFAYLSFANYFGHVNISRKGCYNFFMKMYKEEMEHASNFMKYQLLRGGTVCLKTLQPYPVKQKTIPEFFESSLKIELEILEKLKNLVDLSQKHNDIHCADYVTNKFLKEQIESMSELGSLISILRDVGNTETGLYLFDVELQKIYK